MFAPRDATAFEARPDGGFIAGESWFYFGVDSTLFGYAVWGKPVRDDIQKLVRLLVRELGRPPHAALVDFEHLESVELGAFESLGRTRSSTMMSLREPLLTQRSSHLGVR